MTIVCTAKMKNRNLDNRHTKYSPRFLTRAKQITPGISEKTTCRPISFRSYGGDLNSQCRKDYSMKYTARAWVSMQHKPKLCGIVLDKSTSGPFELELKMKINLFERERRFEYNETCKARGACIVGTKITLIFL